MNDEVAEMKRASLAERQAKRDQANESIIDSLGLDVAEEKALSIEDTQLEEVTLQSKPAPCKKCYGKGEYKPMFMWIECPDCYGTGYSLADPIALIKWQKLCLEWAKKEVQSVRNELRLATTTKEERTEAAMQKMYANSDYNKHE